MSPEIRGVGRRGFLRYSAAGLGLLAAAPALASCASSPGTDDETLRLGAMFPVSGPNAQLGEESWRGVQLSVDKWNAAGGVAGKKVEVVFADTPDVNAATSEARRLVFNNNIKIGFGTYGSSLSLAASEVFARTGNAFVEFGAVSDAITKRGYENVYRYNSTAVEMAVAHMSFISEFLAPQMGKPIEEMRVMMVHEDSSYGQSIVALVKAEAEKVGLVHFENEPYSATSTDLSSTVLRMADFAPDVVIAVSYQADSVLLGRQIRDNNLALGAFIGTGGGHSLASFREALGDAANGVFDVDFTNENANRESTPGLDEFLAAYREKFGSDPASGHSLTNYTGMELLLEILETTGGSDDPEHFREASLAFEKNVGTTPSGWGFALDENNQNSLAHMNVMQWIGDDLLTVYPPEAAVREPELITPFGVVA